jgi:diguanylate cyclase (GGDEF)-like protein/PAS domain S-box-containing protein
MADPGPRIPGEHGLLRSLEPSLELMREAVVATTAEVEPSVVFVNGAFTRLTGCPAADALGKTPRMLGDRAAAREPGRGLFEDLGRRLGAMLPAGETPATEPATDAGPRDVSAWQIMPLADGTGRARHWLAIHRGAAAVAGDRWGRDSDDRTFRHLVEHQPDPICRFLPDTELTFVNTACAALFRRKPEALVGRRILDLLSEEDARAVRAHLASLSPDQPAGRYEHRSGQCRARGATGVRWHLWNTRALFDEDGTVAAYQAVGSEITESKRVDEALRKLSNVVEHSPSTIIITDAEGVIEYVNPAFTHTSGYTLEEAVGKTPRIVKSNMASEQVYADLWRTIRSGRTWHGELPNKAKDGRIYWDLLAVAPVKDPNGVLTHFVGIQHDITQQKLLEQQMAYDATHDALTDLVNRREFERRLERAVASAKQHGCHHILAFIDLDQFKVVNDTAGHAAGDELLKQIRGLLKSMFKGRDTLARLGGDEFALLLDDCWVERARKICEKLIANLKDLRFCWGGHTFQVGASIGLVPITAKTENATLAMSQADVACYAAKERGRNRIRVYHQKGTESALHHGEILRAAALRNAVEEDRLCLYCQPIMALSERGDGAEHFEILVRMIDGDGRLVLPGAFIPAAERYGLIGGIDRWVIKTAFGQFDERFGHLPRARISVNISGHSLNDETFLDYVCKQFRKHSLSPERVCFEITETAAVQSMDHAREFFADIKRNGGFLALDDFGSGLSSFGYLKTLPVDFLKIDGRFVSDMIENSIDHAMVAAINGIGRVMGMRTVAEYAHSAAIVERLSEMGVDYAQGNAIGAPVPLDALDPEDRKQWYASVAEAATTAEQYQ